MDTAALFSSLGITDENPGVFCGEWFGSGPVIEKFSPIDGKLLARVRTATEAEYETTITRAQDAFEKWRVTPGPAPGATVPQRRNAPREPKGGPRPRVPPAAGKSTPES